MNLLSRMLRALLRPWRLGPSVLHVNSGAAPGASERVNLFCSVNAASIRREMFDGREHLVVPSYTLPDDVIMNNGLYPHAEIEASYKQLEGTAAPLGHPVVNGQHVPATHPLAITKHFIGAWNRNVERKDKRIYVEKWIDVEYAKNSEGGRAVLDAIDKGEPIHTSTGLFLQREPARNAAGYSWIARNMKFDHDAILLGEPGAATPEDGVGMMVNVSQARPLVANAAGDSVLSADNYGARQELLTAAARAKWGGPEMYAYVSNFDSIKAIVVLGDGKSFAVSYAIRDGVVEFGTDDQPVERKEVWTEKGPIVNRFLQWLGVHVNSDAPSFKPTTGGVETMPLTPEEKAELVKDFGDAVANQLKPVMAEVESLKSTVGGLETNQKALTESLTANARAAEADKRAVVAAKMGEIVANALTGEPLEEAYKKCLGTTGAISGLATNGNDEMTFELPK